MMGCTMLFSRNNILPTTIYTDTVSAKRPFINNKPKSLAV